MEIIGKFPPALLNCAENHRLLERSSRETRPQLRFDAAAPRGIMGCMIRLAALLMLWPLFPAGAAEERYQQWATQEAAQHADFPTGREMAELARRGVAEVTPEFKSRPADDRLLAWLEAEFALFRAIEQRVCEARVQRKFANVEDFLKEAETITNRRKSRAGHSLEYHVAHLLEESGIAFEVNATVDGKVRPDILLPGQQAYEDRKHPASRLAVLALKTTCKDRWRQVLNEGKRVTVKDLLTLQPEMSQAQLEEMQQARLRVTVPAPLHAGWKTPEGMKLLTVEELLSDLRRRFPAPKP
jgi:hypothetical protein